jgi:hypothetical protein
MCDFASSISPSQFEPIIRVTFSDEKPVLPYDDYEVILFSNLKDLKNNIIKLFEDISYKNTLFKNLDFF